MRGQSGVALIVATILGCMTTAALAADPEIPPAEGPASSEAVPPPEGTETAPPKSAGGANGPAPSAGSVQRPQDTPYPGTIGLHVDVTDLERHVFNVHETIPVQAGPVTLLYPEWIPGNHAPRGPIDGLGGLLINAGGKRLEWS